MEQLASYDRAALDAQYALPPAESLSPNSVVLSMSGTDRSTLRWGFVLWSGALLFGGIALGYYWGRR
jgi:hypothetical protein